LAALSFRTGTARQRSVIEGDDPNWSSQAWRTISSDRIRVMSVQPIRLQSKLEGENYNDYIVMPAAMELKSLPDSLRVTIFQLRAV